MKKNRPEASGRILDSSENVECYEDLANAIILQAVVDYKKELHAILQRDGNFDREDRSGVVHSLKRFFFSPWYSTLTSIDPETLISRVKVLVVKEADERRKKQLERMRRQAEREQREAKSLLAALRAWEVDIEEATTDLQIIMA